MARPNTRRRLVLAAFGVLVLAGAGVPVRAAVAPLYPVQSLGDRGTDVATLQQLIHEHQASTPPPSGGGRGVVVQGRNPLIVPIDGVFGDATEAGVRAFQGSRGLPVTGVVDEETWTRLVVPVGPGATGDAVGAIQRLLREKRGASVPSDGTYGPATTAAVTAFQAHAGLGQTGSVNAATWRALVRHFELPKFSASALCDYSSGNGPANWGTAEMISTLEAAGATMVSGGYGRVVVGDVSLEHGGDIPGHLTHEVGLDADIRPMRKANDQCSAGTRWTMPAYDRTATRALVDAIRAATPGHVQFILFNDPVLIREGLTTYHSGHDDHLHVMLCEAWFPDVLYRC